MKKIIFFVLGLSIGLTGSLIDAYGQTPGQREPLSLQKDSYTPGLVLLRLKSEYAAQGAGLKRESWNELLPGVGVRVAVPLSPQTNNSPSSRQLKKHSIDIRRYQQLTFDPSVPVEEVIEKLYRTGLVDLAEPDYLHTPAYIPNDPRTKDQYYLDIIKAYQAWDISKSSRDIVIAILDSGVQLDHPDLAGNIYVNEKDPINGSDSDNDGFVDNYWGWDFAGSDYANIIEDNDPNANTSSLEHGTLVAGCASAVTDNSIGIAGVGFNSRLMVLKHMADNDDRNGGSGYLINLLRGVLYAANKEADVINASYGSAFYSQIAQDVYKYVALEYDVVIVAAAGNAGNTSPNYPSDYDYVLSVAASNSKDERADFSNYGYRVDITAPGDGILTTSVQGNYRTASGTSFAAPIVAGAAALLKTKYPDFNGAQIAELLRVTADKSFNDRLSDTYKNKMGRGRLDVYEALTKTSPAIRFDNSFLLGPGGDIVKAGEEAALGGDFINFLWPAQGARVTLTSLHNRLTVVEPVVELGTMQMMDLVSVADNPFRISVSANMPPNTEVVLRLDYEADGGYTDYQYIQILVNPTYFILNENLISTTIAGNGRIGYRDSNRKQGIGFVYNELNMLYEMGVMIGTSKDKLVSSVRSTNTSYDDDFREVELINRNTPGQVGDADIWGSFNDLNAPFENRLGVEVHYRAYAWREEPYEKMVIVEYEVLNNRAQPLENLYFGLYADWDINQENSRDKADWDATTQTGYVYTPAEEDRWVAGIQVLNGTPNYWAIDNDQSVQGNPFGVYDGFTDAEKFRSLSSGIGRKQAGLAAEGEDVSHTVSSGPFTIHPGHSVTVAFALHGGSTIEEVLVSAKEAASLYESTRYLPRPNPAAVTGIVLDELPSLEIYPNPTKGIVTILLPTAASQPFTLTVYDMAGRRMLTNAYAAGSEMLSLDLSGRTGLHLIEIRQGGKRSVRRISVQ
jgi:serine protease